MDYNGQATFVTGPCIRCGKVTDVGIVDRLCTLYRCLTERAKFAEWRTKYYDDVPVESVG